MPEKIPIQIQAVMTRTKNRWLRGYTGRWGKVYQQNRSVVRSKETTRKKPFRHCFIILIILQTLISFSFSSTNDEEVGTTRQSARRDKKERCCFRLRLLLYEKHGTRTKKERETIIRAYNGMSQCGGPEAAQNEQKKKRIIGREERESERFGHLGQRRI